jgi:4-azaleucine resistance transporter AzlC
MSLLVYAGSSQLIAVGLFEAGVPAVTIILTTFVVNLRHLLMSAALAPFLRRWRRAEQAAFAYELTDESFALLKTRLQTTQLPKAEFFGVNMTMQIGWLVGTWLGIVAGQLVQDVELLALDYALPAMFVALLVLQIKERTAVAVAVFSAGFSVGMVRLGLTQWNIILATLLGATLGVGIQAWNKMRSS